jgi:hypothetical protein
MTVAYRRLLMWRGRSACREARQYWVRENDLASSFRRKACPKKGKSGSIFCGFPEAASRVTFQRDRMRVKAKEMRGSTRKEIVRSPSSSVESRRAPSRFSIFGRFVPTDTFRHLKIIGERERSSLGPVIAHDFAATAPPAEVHE